MDSFSQTGRKGRQVVDSKEGGRRALTMLGQEVPTLASSPRRMRGGCAAGLGLEFCSISASRSCPRPSVTSASCEGEPAATRPPPFSSSRRTISAVPCHGASGGAAARPRRRSGAPGHALLVLHIHPRLQQRHHEQAAGADRRARSVDSPLLAVPCSGTCRTVDFQHHRRIGERNDFLWGAGFRNTSDSIDNTLFATFTPDHRADQTFSSVRPGQDRAAARQAVPDRRLQVRGQRLHGVGSAAQPALRLAHQRAADVLGGGIARSPHPVAPRCRPATDCADHRAGSTVSAVHQRQRQPRLQVGGTARL